MLENKKILPDSGLSEKDKEKITQSTEYIFSMGYQNELEYLGEDFNFYDDFSQTFGFDPYYDEYYYSAEGSYFQANLEGTASLNISGYDYLCYTSFPVTEFEKADILGSFTHNQTRTILIFLKRASSL
jgi:hypothetical protein